MKIKLSPVLSETEVMIVSVEGDAITINDEVFNFTMLPAGYEMSISDIDSHWFIEDPVKKNLNGELSMTLRFPFPLDAGEEMKFPKPITVVKNGILNLPTYTPPVKELLPPPSEIEYEDVRLYESPENANSSGNDTNRE